MRVCNKCGHTNPAGSTACLKCYREIGQPYTVPSKTGSKPLLKQAGYVVVGLCVAAAAALAIVPHTNDRGHNRPAARAQSAAVTHNAPENITDIPQIAPVLPASVYVMPRPRIAPPEQRTQDVPLPPVETIPTPTPPASTTREQRTSPSGPATMHSSHAERDTAHSYVPGPVYIPLPTFPRNDIYKQERAQEELNRQYLRQIEETKRRQEELIRQQEAMMRENKRRQEDLQRQERQIQEAQRRQDEINRKQIQQAKEDQRKADATARAQRDVASAQQELATANERLNRAVSSNSSFVDTYTREVESAHSKLARAQSRLADVQRRGW